MASLMTRKKYLETINYSDHIYQWEEGYRFSVDALLISGFVNYEKREVCALDIGTGSGLIPLLLHKKYPIGLLMVSKFKRIYITLQKKIIN